MRGKVIEVFAWLVASTLLIGFALLSDTLTGGQVSSLRGLWRDLVALDAGVLLRALWWLMILLPLAWLLVMVRDWRRTSRDS